MRTTPTTAPPALVLDLIESPATGKAIGGVDGPGGYDIPICIKRYGRTWEGYAGTADEFRGEGPSLKVAMQQLAEDMRAKGVPLTGSFLVRKDWNAGYQQLYTL